MRLVVGLRMDRFIIKNKQKPTDKITPVTWDICPESLDNIQPTMATITTV
jgi:hypothetical protein